jgi:hypothetical protein
VVESWSARLVAERPTRSGGAGYAVLVAVNGGSQLLICVLRAAHSHDLSLSPFRARGSLITKDRRAALAAPRRITRASTNRGHSRWRDAISMAEKLNPNAELVIDDKS